MPDDTNAVAMTPGSLPYNIAVGNTAQPNIPSAKTSPATEPDFGGPSAEGLSGGNGIPVTAPQPPKPEESVARHIMEALSGASGGHPMDWARATISGGLAAAANVGKVPSGSGWLAGASKAAAGLQEQKQVALANQAKQQEMALKQKADARAEQELQIHMEDAKTQRAMWNAQTAASIQTQQQNAARFKDLQEADRLHVRELQDKVRESEQDQLAVLSAAGVDVSKLDHITGYDQLTTDHAKQAGAGGIFAVPNGEEHKEGEDKAGAYMVPGDVWDRPITKPITITTGYEVDPKTGKATPKTMTAQEGTKVGTLLAIAKGAQMDLQKKQQQIFDQAKVEHERAGTEHEKAETAKTDEELKQLREWDTGGGERKDSFGNPVGAPGMDKKEYVKRVDTYNKDYSKDLNQLDQARTQLADIIHNAETTGKLPGADAVVGIFDAIGISSAPLKGRGFRINSQIVGEHVEGTRNAWQGLGLKLSRLTPEGTGQIVSLQQLKDYERIMDAARHDAYIGAGNDAVNRGIGIQSVPRGNGAVIDENTMDIFLTMAKGNPQLASQIAKQYGWNPPAK